MSNYIPTHIFTILIVIIFLIIAIILPPTNCARQQRQKPDKLHNKNDHQHNNNNVMNNNNNNNRHHRNSIRSRQQHYYQQENYCELEIKCREDDTINNLSLPIRLPIKGPRGPAGPPGPRGERGPAGASIISPGSSGLSHQASAASLLKRKVAFCVGLVPNMGPVVERTTIKFDKIVTNFGSAYDSNTGIVTAPVRGVYHFTVIISAQSQQKAAVAILHNNDLVATVWSESKPFWSTSNSVIILELKKGDKVWLDLLPKASFLHGFMYTSFSGFIIFDY